MVFLVVLGMLGGLVVGFAPAAQNATPCDPGFRLVVHVAGETCAPTDPQRVVVLHPVTTLDNALALGVTPVGTAVYNDRYAVAPYLIELGLVDADIAPVGSTSEPNLEAILALQPDLILARDYHEYALLSDIAPTVVLVYQQADWRAYFLGVADALNRTAQAEEILAGYDARVDAIADMLGAERDQIEVSVVRVRPDALRLYVNNALSGMVLADLGLGRPAAQNVEGDNSPFVTISLEELQAADGDIIFVWGEIAGTEEVLASLQANPLWQSLRGVQAERVEVVSEAAWFAPGIIGVHLLLDDIVRHVAGEDPAVVAPNPFLPPADEPVED